MRSRADTNSDEAEKTVRDIITSFRPVINIAGRPRPDAASALHSSLPLLSGRFTSTTIHALALGIALASNALGRVESFKAGGSCQSRQRAEHGRVVVHH
jgi:hypothetical protein